MTKLIGWTFILLSPFVGGTLALALVYQLMGGKNWEVLFVAASGAWVLLYCLWFDGSKYQRNLLK